LGDLGRIPKHRLFGKDIAKMNKEQSNAAIFFREMVQYMKPLGADSR
jgi:hypothetical protein